MNVLVTGGSGFVGSTLVREMTAAGHHVRVATRDLRERGVPYVTQVRVENISESTDWSEALDGIDAVVHLAARAHVLREREADPKAAFMLTNYGGTRRLADACRGRVGRFVFMSTIAVHGSQGGDSVVRSEGSAIAPDTPYGRSKARAEDHLAELRERGDLDSVSLRPPLTYGSGAPGGAVAICLRGQSPKSCRTRASGARCSFSVGGSAGVARSVLCGGSRSG